MATPFERKLFDEVFVNRYAGKLIDLPSYEAALIEGLTHSVVQGDRVAIIGGGYGITAVIASQLAGESGRIVVYEGSQEQVEHAKIVFSRNKTASKITICHAIVGDNIGVYGSDRGQQKARLIKPQELADCDVLEMDCEGSEIGILKNLGFRPRAIIVETHGYLGSATEEVRNILESLSYKVSDLGVAEPHLASVCDERDIRVLLAKDDFV